MRSISTYIEEGFLRGIGGDLKDGITFLGLLDSLKALFGDSDKAFSVIKSKINDINYFIKQNKFKGHTGEFIKFLSSIFMWRFYFLLDDSTYKDFIQKLKDNKLEKIFVDVNFGKRVIKEIYDSKSNEDLFKVTDKYLKRAENILILCKRNDIPENIASNVMNIFAQGALDLEYVIRKVIRYND